MYLTVLSTSSKDMMFILLWEDCSPEDSTLKHHRHLGCCRPFSFPIMSFHSFVLSLPFCPVLSVNIYILSGLPPVVPWKENTSHMLFSIHTTEAVISSTVLTSPCMPNATSYSLWAFQGKSQFLHPINNSLSPPVISVPVHSQILHSVHLWYCEYWPLNVHPHSAK